MPARHERSADADFCHSLGAGEQPTAHRLPPGGHKQVPNRLKVRSIRKVFIVVMVVVEFAMRFQRGTGDGGVRRGGAEARRRRGPERCQLDYRWNGYFCLRPRPFRNPYTAVVSESVKFKFDADNSAPIRFPVSPVPTVHELTVIGNGRQAVLRGQNFTRNLSVWFGEIRV